MGVAPSAGLKFCADASIGVGREADEITSKQGTIEACFSASAQRVGGEHPALPSLAARCERAYCEVIGMPFFWRGSLLNSVDELRAA